MNHTTSKKATDISYTSNPTMKILQHSLSFCSVQKCIMHKIWTQTHSE